MQVNVLMEKVHILWIGTGLWVKQSCFIKKNTFPGLKLSEQYLEPNLQDIYFFGVIAKLFLDKLILQNLFRRSSATESMFH